MYNYVWGRVEIFPKLEYQLNSPVLVHNAHDVLVRETINRGGTGGENVSQMMSRFQTHMPFSGKGRRGRGQDTGKRVGEEGGVFSYLENIGNMCHVSVRYFLQVLIKEIKINLVPKYFLFALHVHILLTY